MSPVHIVEYIDGKFVPKIISQGEYDNRRSSGKEVRSYGSRQAAVNAASKMNKVKKVANV